MVPPPAELLCLTGASSPFGISDRYRKSHLQYSLDPWRVVWIMRYKSSSLSCRSAPHVVLGIFRVKMSFLKLSLRSLIQSLPPHMKNSPALSHTAQPPRTERPFQLRFILVLNHTFIIDNKERMITFAHVSHEAVTSNKMIRRTEASSTHEDPHIDRQIVHLIPEAARASPSAST